MKKTQRREPCSSGEKTKESNKVIMKEMRGELSYQF